MLCALLQQCRLACGCKHYRRAINSKYFAHYFSNAASHALRFSKKLKGASTTPKLARVGNEASGLLTESIKKKQLKCQMPPGEPGGARHARAQGALHCNS